jgi:hypothetical protein
VAPALGTADRRVHGLLLHRRTQARALAEQQPGLFIQVRTVDSHRANIGQKLNLTGPYALLRHAMQHRHEL